MMFDALSPNWSGRTWRITMLWPRDPQELMRRSLLRVLAVAHRERFDPATLVANLAEEHRGRNRRRLRRLANRLRGGMPVVTALEQTPEVLSDAQVLAIRFGSQTGTLTATYDDLISKIQQPPSTASRDLRQTAIYLGFMSLFVIWILSFLFTFIYPTFGKIDDYFEISDPPYAVDLMYRLSNQMGAGTAILAILAILALPFLWSSPIGRWVRRTLATSRLRWVWQLRIAELLEWLAQSIEAGRPLSGVSSVLARYHFDKPVRQRLLFARNEMEQGASAWESLRSAGLLTAQEYRSLSDSTSPQTQVWLLRNLANQKRERSTSAGEAAARGLQTLATLAVAVVVLVVSLAGYQALIHIVEKQL
ncbi:MAG: hypothetical protein EA381_08460 [Planctomycetaceae bacterium]|nr:MAG: hypothetical protein EA381_08460 [Planctomycetaceae bacterium]